MSWASQTFSAVKRFAVPSSALVGEERDRAEAERIEANRARTAGVMPVVVALQLLMLVAFRPRDDGLYAAFREGVFWIHAGTVPISAILALLALRMNKWQMRGAWFGDVVLIFAVGLGLVLSLNTNRLMANLNSFNIGLFAGTLIVRPTMFGTLLSYGGSVIGLVVGLAYLQPNSEVRLSTTTAGVSAVLISIAFSRVLDFAFVREVAQRITIERQQAELRTWNAELERRVKEQVAETLSHADQVRQLDAQLRWKVRDRSKELARALRTQPFEDGPLTPGTSFERRFQIERIIGSGAMGDVYGARDDATGQEVAIKVLRRSEDLAPEDITRFISEAAAAATVIHPAIVRTYHVDITEAGHFYLVMELVRGRTLADELLQGRYDAAQTARFGAVVGEALAAAHATGVVHRDIKPHNLMLTTTKPGVRVLDFGVSKLLDADVGEMTISGQVVGTPQYMAPEQIVRSGKVTGACDVYALGQVLYEMLCGEPCFTGATVRDVLRAQVAEAPVSVRTRAGATAVPEELSGLIAQCLEKAPHARPSADSLAAALRVIADSLSAPPLEGLGPPRFEGTKVRLIDIGAATVRADNS